MSTESRSDTFGETKYLRRRGEDGVVASGGYLCLVDLKRRAGAVWKPPDVGQE